MKIIIDYNGIKREISGSFLICGSREDFQTLKDCLKLEDGASYGWVKVVDNPPMSVNTKPIHWNEV